VTELAIKLLLSYLTGSVLGSLVVGRLRGGVDIRTLGSGNAGGTNALRTQGRAFALAVMVIDVGKGWIVTRLLAPSMLPAIAPAPAHWREWLPTLCGVAAIAGHVWPVWYGLRGGKGVATLIGSLAGMQPILLAPVLLTWLLVAALSGFVGLASMAAALALPVYVAVSGVEPRAPQLTFGVLVAALVVLTHRSNMARMRAGTEPRARRLWLFGGGRG